MYYYVDATRENDFMALPDVEVFEYREGESPGIEAEEDEAITKSGWYYAYGFPGCLWDSFPVGPFSTEVEALKEARSSP